MTSPLNNYLKTYRKVSGLSQNDVAFLIGKQTPASISRLEHNNTKPNLRDICILEVLYDKPLRDLFEGQCKDSEIYLVGRAKLLIPLLEKRGKREKILKKIDYLEGVINRFNS